MKKHILSVILLAVIALMLCSCIDHIGIDIDKVSATQSAAEQALQAQIEQEYDLYPYYASLSGADQATYIRICTAIKEHNNGALFIGEYDSQTACRAAQENLQELFHHLTYEHAEYFWVDMYGGILTTKETNQKFRLYFTPEYLMDAQAAQDKKAEFSTRVNTIVAEAQQEQTLFDRILYVYDYIIENTDYNDSLTQDGNTDTLGKNAYGCLVDGKTICSGYAQAFTVLMQRLGVPTGVEFNDYNGESAAVGHVWNYCRIDGEYYYFDLTWDDGDFEDDSYKITVPYTHNYFAITGDELALSHTISPAARTPACNGTAYNYYVYNGWNIENYTFEQAKQCILDQQDSDFITLRFNDPDQLSAAEEELLTGQRIGEILPGIISYTYFISKSNLHLTIIVQ